MSTRTVVSAVGAVAFFGAAAGALAAVFSAGFAGTGFDASTFGTGAALGLGTACFAAGFSTKEEISDISGRGVGMDVVKTKITQLNGSVSIQSELGVGTTLEIKVPLTLAILPTLMVVVGEQTFALPLAGVSEIFHLDLTKTNVVDSQLTIIVRKKAIPLFYLEHWLVKGADRSQRKAHGHVVIVQIGTQQVGFVVDSLIGQEEVVIKPLDALLQGTPGMAGATITSDGGIALILDVPNMLKHYAG